MHNRCAIAVMAKAPVPGRAKTRLVPPLTPDGAAALSGAFLSDITGNLAQAARHAPIDGWVAYAPAGSEELFAARAVPGTALLLADGRGEMPAGVGGLGRCLLHAARGLSARGYAALCLVNSDSPTLPTGLLSRAASLLLDDPRRVVLGPAEDGGYYLIGMSAPHSSLFEGIAWSTSRVAAETRARVAALRLPLVELDAWYDVDDPPALERLRGELDCPMAKGFTPYAAPATSACLDRLGLRRGRMAAE